MVERNEAANFELNSTKEAREMVSHSACQEMDVLESDSIQTNHARDLGRSNVYLDT